MIKIGGQFNWVSLNFTFLESGRRKASETSHKLKEKSYFIISRTKESFSIRVKYSFCRDKMYLS